MGWTELHSSWGGHYHARTGRNLNDVLLNCLCPLPKYRTTLISLRLVESQSVNTALYNSTLDRNLAAPNIANSGNYPNPCGLRRGNQYLPQPDNSFKLSRRSARSNDYQKWFQPNTSMGDERMGMPAVEIPPRETQEDSASRNSGLADWLIPTNTFF